MYLVTVMTPGATRRAARTLSLSEIPDKTRFEHTHVLGASGWGKTQLLESMILADLKRPPATVPSLVVVDSQGHMLERIARLAVFDPNAGALKDRLIIIDPTDVDHPPAMNLFAVNRKRLGAYDARTKAEVLNGIVSLYGYVFESLLDAKSTQRQKMVLGYLTRLMLCMPGASLDTLRQLLSDHTPALKAHAGALDPGTLAFFTEEFAKPDYRRVAGELLRRLWGLMEDPTLAAMFTAKENKVDLNSALQSGKVVLVNTALGFLKGERSSLLGRMLLALVLQAVLERAGESNPRPAHIIIDEAAEYVDDNLVVDFLRQARKYRAGVVLAHQDLGQLKGVALKSAIATNTGIKIVGGISARDARTLSVDMKTTPEFLTGQKKTAKGSQFAAFVRGQTTTALSLPVVYGVLDREPQMPAAAFAELKEKNRRRVSG